jgi:uncharacterized protein (DUF1499 family)
MKKIFLILTFLIGSSCMGSDIKLGVEDNKLSPCPPKDNCVCSFEEREKYKIAPYKYTDKNKTLTKLVNILETTDRVKIVEKVENYIRAEYKTKIFRWVDDVEFYFDESSQLLHFRSASRTGYSDMGVNRSRIEKIRSMLTH